MSTWTSLLHLGDPAWTVPLAAAIAAWLGAAGAWRAAAAWLLLFGAALGIVGADKILFLGWGDGLPALDYHAASGHAAGVTALAPMLLTLLMPQCRLSAVLGVAAGLLMAALLVALNEHTVAEALAGWIIGASAGLAALLLPLPRAPGAHALAPAAGTFLLIAVPMHAVPSGYWLIKAALLVSGGAHLFPLHH